MLLLWLALSTWLALPLAAKVPFRTVVIDPGHGGKDKGRISSSCYYEKIYTLDVAKRLQTILHRERIPSVMTRYADKTVSLEQRAKLANQYQNIVFVSIHFNASTDRRIRGIETYYLSRKSQKIAWQVQDALADVTGEPDRGVKKSDFYVLRETKAPALLIECGFLSNTKDLKLAQSPEYRQKLAQAIANGLLKYRQKFLDNKNFQASRLSALLSGNKPLAFE